MAPSATQAQGVRRIGRPKRIDHQKISTLALDLFERDGFDQVTMNEIANAAAVSRRTLFREFPSKADLVWYGLDQFVEAVRKWNATPRLGGAGPTLRQYIEELAMPALRAAEEPPLGELTRRRLRLIAENPGLLHHQTLLELRAELTTAIAASDTFAGQPAALVADVFVAIGFSSALWWATTGERATLIEAFRMALNALQGMTGGQV
jgi:AcrR family transcriptional regulator